MSDHESSPRQQGNIAGAGIGTGYVGILTGLPESLHWLRDALVLLAPIITICTSVAWIFLAAWAMKKMVNWNLTQAISEATAICDDICNDPNSSDVDKSNAQQAVGDLKRIKLDAVKQSVSDVRARLTQIRNG